MTTAPSWIVAVAVVRKALHSCMADPCAGQCPGTSGIGRDIPLVSCALPLFVCLIGGRSLEPPCLQSLQQGRRQDRGAPHRLQATPCPGQL